MLSQQPLPPPARQRWLGGTTPRNPPQLSQPAG
jgi:hypothetical protein